nr:winged helix-turn-helix transcriptional regulator [uncultured Rhodopila sp.]
MKGDPASRAEGERTRAAVVAAIASGAIQQKGIQDRIGLSLGVVSHHVRQLIAAGTVREATPRRGRIAATYSVIEP